jgi:hypothetical protein
VTSVNNWYDVTDYGAAGNRTTDDAPAIGSAITACIAGGGGTVYFPGGTNGHYLINEPIAVSTTVPISFLGDNAKGTWNDTPGASAICCGFVPTSTAATYYAVSCITPSGFTAPAFNMSNMLVLADGENTLGATVEFSGIFTCGLWDSTLTNVSVGNGLGNGFNTGVHMAKMFGGLLENCNAIAGNQQGFWMDDGAGIEVSDSGFTSVVGNGYGNIRMDNNAGTLRIRNCVSIQGDRGLYVPDGSVSAFIFIYDYEINNPRVEGIGLYGGSELWADQLWFTQAGEPNTTLRNNITFGEDYTGYVNIVNSALGSSTGHNVSIEGGSGYSFTGCSFGDASSYSSGDYDCLNVGANCNGAVSVSNCHFGMDPYSGVGDARSAVYTNGDAGGPVVLTGNMFAPTGWGTAIVMDYANQVVAHGNSGWKHEVQTTTSQFTANTASWEDLTPPYAINPYEATIGDVYRLVAWGDGTMASGTAVNLDIEGQLGGNAVGYSILSGAVIGAGNGFHWKCTIDLVVTGNGVASPGLNFTWGESVTSTVNNQNASTASNPSGVSFNQDTGTSCFLQAQWASTAGSPDIICRGSYLQCITL